MYDIFVFEKQCLLIKTAAPNLRSTRASHDSQYTRYMTFSDALENSFFTRAIPLWTSLV